MSERKQLSGSDWLGITLFALGSLGAVLMFLAMSTNGPVAEQGTLGPYAGLWTATLGMFPSLFFNAAIAFLGARLFLEIGRGTLLRNALGCAGLAVALAVICGAWKIDAGGYIGARTGAVVSEYTHVALGTLIGLMAFFAVAWFAWFRSGAIAAQAEEASAPIAAAAERSAPKFTVRAVGQKPTTTHEGVSPAESAALFPEDDEPAVVKKLTPDDVARVTHEIPPSPYPEDVRRKGQIPAGTRPLETPHASTTTESPMPAPAVYRWTAPREEPADDGARAHLAETPAAAEPEALEREEAPELSATEARLPTAPSWEQAPIAFKPEEGDEEPVDAYGTPLTLVEKLRQARREGGIDAQSALPLVEGDALEAPEAIVPKELDADIVPPAPSWQAASFEALEPQASAEAEAAQFEELELESTDLYDETDVDETEESEETDEVDDGAAAYEEAGDVIVEAEEEELTVIAEAEEEVVEPPVTTVRPARIPELQPSLFDAVPAPAPAVEREVVLQPVAAAAPVARTPKEQPVVDGDARIARLSEIGCLFIERGRVAVSMLQRQYEMDFDDACKVLDELQELGLIGPYLGGQRRDILLTREQWLERISQVTASS
jgi:hypothetical protein